MREEEWSDSFRAKVWNAGCFVNSWRVHLAASAYISAPTWGKQPSHGCPIKCDSLTALLNQQSGDSFRAQTRRSIRKTHACYYWFACVVEIMQGFLFFSFLLKQERKIIIVTFNINAPLPRESERESEHRFTKAQIHSLNVFTKPNKCLFMHICASVWLDWSFKFTKWSFWNWHLRTSTCAGLKPARNRSKALF